VAPALIDTLLSCDAASVLDAGTRPTGNGALSDATPLSPHRLTTMRGLTEHGVNADLLFTRTKGAQQPSATVAGTASNFLSLPGSVLATRTGGAGGPSRQTHGLMARHALSGALPRLDPPLPGTVTSRTARSTGADGADGAAHGASPRRGAAPLHRAPAACEERVRAAARASLALGGGPVQGAALGAGRGGGCDRDATLLALAQPPPSCSTFAGQVTRGVLAAVARALGARDTDAATGQPMSEGELCASIAATSPEAAANLGYPQSAPAEVGNWRARPLANSGAMLGMGMRARLLQQAPVARAEALAAALQGPVSPAQALAATRLLGVYSSIGFAPSPSMAEVTLPRDAGPHHGFAQEVWRVCVVFSPASPAPSALQVQQQAAAELYLASAGDAGAEARARARAARVLASSGGVEPAQSLVLEIVRTGVVPSSTRAQEPGEAPTGAAGSLWEVRAALAAPPGDGVTPNVRALAPTAVQGSSVLGAASASPFRVSVGAFSLASASPDGSMLPMRVSGSIPSAGVDFDLTLDGEVEHVLLPGRGGRVPVREPVAWEGNAVTSFTLPALSASGSVTVRAPQDVRESLARDARTDVQRQEALQKTVTVFDVKPHSSTATVQHAWDSAGASADGWANLLLLLRGAVSPSEARPPAAQLTLQIARTSSLPGSIGGDGTLEVRRAAAALGSLALVGTRTTPGTDNGGSDATAMDLGLVASELEPASSASVAQLQLSWSPAPLASGGSQSSESAHAAEVSVSGTVLYEDGQQSPARGTVAPTRYARDTAGSWMLWPVEWRLQVRDAAGHALLDGMLQATTVEAQNPANTVDGMTVPGTGGKESQLARGDKTSADAADVVRRATRTKPSYTWSQHVENATGGGQAAASPGGGGDKPNSSGSGSGSGGSSSGGNGRKSHETARGQGMPSVQRRADGSWQYLGGVVFRSRASTARDGEEHDAQRGGVGGSGCLLLVNPQGGQAVVQAALAVLNQVATSSTLSLFQQYPRLPGSIIIALLCLGAILLVAMIVGLVFWMKAASRRARACERAIAFEDAVRIAARGHDSAAVAVQRVVSDADRITQQQLKAADTGDISMVSTRTAARSMN